MFSDEKISIKPADAGFFIIELINQMFERIRFGFFGAVVLWVLEVGGGSLEPRFLLTRQIIKVTRSEHVEPPLAQGDTTAEPVVAAYDF